MNAEDFKDLHRLEIVLGETDESPELMEILAKHDPHRDYSNLQKVPVFIATWFVYDDKKCDHGHLHKIYKTKKNKDLIKLLEEIKQDA